MDASNTMLIDPGELRSRFAGKADLLRRLTKIFSEQTPQLLARLRHAVRRGDAPGVEWTAHTLKGSLAQLGARATAELAQQIESAARTSAPGRSETVIMEFELHAAQIQRLLNELATSPEL